MSTPSQDTHVHDAHEIGKNVKTQIRVGIALVVFTIFAVAVSFFPFHSQTTRIVAVVAVAFFNAALVSGISMHLKTEKKIIGKFLIFTVIFVLVLFGLTALAFLDSTRLH